MKYPNKRSALAVLAVVSMLAVAGCTAEDTPEVTTTAEPAVITNETAPETTDEEVVSEEEVAEEEVEVSTAAGEAPFDIDTTTTTAKVGEAVLAPPRSWIDDAFTDGADSTTFIYYDSEVLEVGEVESTLDDGFDEEAVPNSMIIPLPAGETAAKGDVLLTWWQSGSGLQRAYVTDATDPTAPEVLYLDIDYDNPATTSEGTPIAQASEQIEPDTFTVLTDIYQPGTAIAYLKDSEYEHGQVVNVVGDKILVLGFAGIMEAVDADTAIALPIKPSVAAGDPVWFPLFGSMSEATVTGVDEEIGRVFVEYDWIGEPTEEVVPFGDIIPADGLQ